MMKHLILGLLTLNVSWTCFADSPFKNTDLDDMLANPFATLDNQIEKAQNFTKTSGYDFDPEQLNEIGALARREYDKLRSLHPLSSDDITKFTLPSGGHWGIHHLAVAHRFEGIAKNVHTHLRNIYKDKILEKPVRVINHTGGIWAVMEVYNCSMTEYLAIFGTVLPQGPAFSGIYPFMKVWDIMVDGVMVSHGIESNTTLPMTYGPGEVSLLENGERRLYTMSEGAMMIDYGRGFIPAALDQGIFTPYRNNKDYASATDQVVDCIKSYLKL